MHKLWLLASTAGKGLLQCVLIVALTFLFCRTIPGDAVDVLGLEGGLTAEQAAAIRQALKLAGSVRRLAQRSEPRRLGTVASFRPIRIGHAP